MSDFSIRSVFRRRDGTGGESQPAISRLHIKLRFAKAELSVGIIMGNAAPGTGVSQRTNSLKQK